MAIMKYLSFVISFVLKNDTNYPKSVLSRIRSKNIAVIGSIRQRIATNFPIAELL
jgi:hypothetical protein